ncbi:DUF3604 domain-containing protein [Denitratisoma oestradiolicum]|uniref:DUF3604 domain-containing protein n=1 Tax=Denitratisoma oestradiolicum TaxID=311182 RepID=A0A6S6YQ38_9PROT|nr:DUF3604 domain-containing protein [Denitratisoma oestradiolicum]TWO78879.1 hypothetical protein CBW56_17815 [Denitratisoma oestradiolicum]CAB1369882.1 conserved protein of unknown function [Denitratisoma oestradiolicum]
MKVQRHDPLDFLAVTDHAEFMGVLNQLDDPNSYLSLSEFGRLYREQIAVVTDRRDQGEAAMRSLKKSPVLQTPYTKDVMRSEWGRQIAMANANYRPGKFTTFIGYEWTSHPQDRYNLHRNVIFRGDTAPMPFSATDSLRPEDLWSYLEANRAQGIEALAIPHNGNASEGNMWAWTDSDGRQISADYARRRAANEPLNEIAQGKGQSETMPAMSPADEFANFEVMDRLVPRLDLKGSPPGSYVRDALGRGLLIQRRTGVNPYKFGAVGGTDFHNGLTTSAENALILAFGFDPDVNPPSRKEAQFLLQEPAAMNPPPLILGSGGLTGVWAERNDRPSIYAAMRRRETFSTSGTRIKVRLFGGWDYPNGLMQRDNWVRNAYARGVPMGSDLPARAKNTAAPRLLIWAAKDPNGANLDRVQIVKVWLDGDQQRERVFDVALSNGRRVNPTTGKAPPVGNTVDLNTATYRNDIGAVQLATEWTDPTFDAAQPAVFYVRVIEIPTPRWSTILAARYQLPLPKSSPATLQERAWSSPIWYMPEKL